MNTLTELDPTGWPEMMYFPPPTDEQIDELIKSLWLQGVELLSPEELRQTIREWVKNL